MCEGEGEREGGGNGGKFWKKGRKKVGEKINMMKEATKRTETGE